MKEEEDTITLTSANGLGAHRQLLSLHRLTHLNMRSTLLSATIVLHTARAAVNTVCFLLSICLKERLIISSESNSSSHTLYSIAFFLAMIDLKTIPADSPADPPAYTGRHLITSQPQATAASQVSTALDCYLLAKW